MRMSRNSGRFAGKAARGLFLAAVTLPSAAAPVVVEIAPSFAGLPASERIVYAESVGGVAKTATQELRLVAKGGKSWYEISYDSEDSSSIARFDAKTLFPFYVETTTRGDGDEIRQVTELLSFTRKLKPDELGILDAASLTTQLRGFPWGREGSAKLVFLGNGDSESFSLELKVQGKETIAVGGASYECYKAQLGMTGVWGAIFPKTSLWFSAASPHFLVKSEGLSGGPGSPKRVVEIRSYESS